MVRGLPGNHELPDQLPGTEVYNHLSAVSLNELICSSEFVIARSGYSTIMDLVQLGKKNILIPTPGQPEQEYLAAFLHSKKIIFSVTEDEFVLEKCLQEAKQFSFKQNEVTHLSLTEVIGELKGAVKKINKPLT